MTVNEQVTKLMSALGISEAEAKDVMAYDKEVDKAGAKTQLAHDLDPEKAKIAKSFAKSGTKKMPTTYKFESRQRKENPTKGSIIAELAKFLTECSENAVENLEITNKERQIAFKIGENAYELTLTQKRKPKS